MAARTSAEQVADRTATRRTATVWDHAILARGVAAGLLGAAVIAAIFLIFDWAQGEPLRTPALLGSRLLHHAPGEPGGDPRLLQLTYTALHVLVFIAIGAIAAFLAADLGPRRTWHSLPLVGGALFAAMAVLLLSFSALFDPTLIAQLGWGRVALANLLAAAAMTPVVLRAHSDPETRP